MSKDLKTSFELGGEAVSLEARLAGERLEVKVAGAASAWDVAFPAPGEVLLRGGTGRTVRAFVVEGPGENELSVSIDGRVVRLPRKTERGRGARAHGHHDAALEAPMPGTCREVFVKAGDRVEKGARLLLIEAMKMEHEVRSPRAGVVTAVNVARGATVAPGTALVEIGA